MKVPIRAPRKVLIRDYIGFLGTIPHCKRDPYGKQGQLRTSLTSVRFRLAMIGGSTP